MNRIKGKSWTQAEFDRAVELDKAGLSYAAIGEAIGRTDKAVRTRLSRGFGGEVRVARGVYHGADGPPISFSPEDRRLSKSAVTGSRKLAKAINAIAATRGIDARLLWNTGNDNPKRRISAYQAARRWA